MAESGISLDEVSIRFGSTVVVENFSLVVPPGAFVSIVGPSGCGKTTVLNLIAGLLKGQGTQKCLVAGSPPRSGNRDVAYMLARDALCPWRTALGNAELGAEVRGVAREERRERALALLAKVGLTGFEQAYPKALSHGMRQRVALARTFSLDSPVLLMDEPFGALDAQTKLQLEECLLSLWEGERKTVLFITHDLSEAISMSDMVIVMTPRPGRICAVLPIDLPRPRDVRSLQKDPAYHAIYSRLWAYLEEGLAP